MSLSLPRSLSRARGITVVMLLAAFVLSQTLGWLHRGLHDTSQGTSLARASAVSQGHGSTGTDSWVAGLFPHDAGSKDCRLYDILSPSGCPAAAQLALLHAVPSGPPDFTAPAFVARQVAHFDARGPPAFH